MWIWARFYCLLPLPGWLVFLRGLEIRSWLWYTCVLKVEGSHSRVPKSDMEKPSLPCSSVTGLRPQCRDLPKGCTLSWRSARIADPWSLQLAALQPPEVYTEGKSPFIRELWSGKWSVRIMMSGHGLPSRAVESRFWDCLYWGDVLCYLPSSEEIHTVQACDH